MCLMSGHLREWARLPASGAGVDGAGGGAAVGAGAGGAGGVATGSGVARFVGAGAAAARAVFSSGGIVRLVGAGAVASLAMLATAGVSAAQDKVYEIARLEARLELEPDGSYRVREEITYDFRVGSFTFAVRDIPLSATDGVSEVAVESPDVTIERLEQSEEDGSRRVRWEFPPRSGLATFVLTYELRGALREVGESNEVLWRVVGSGWEVPFREIEAEVVIPADLDVSAAQVVLDPPDVGTVGERDGQVVARFATGALPEETSYQVRVSFPKVVAGRAVGLGRAEVRATLAGILGAVVMILLGVLVAHRRRGPRLPVRRQSHPGVDIPTAAVLLHRSGPMWERALPATLFDLAGRGVVTLERIDRKGRVFTSQKTILHRTAEADEPLSPFEESLLAEVGASETLEDFASEGKKVRKALMQGVVEEMTEAGLLQDTRSEAGRWGMLGILLFIAAVGLFVVGLAMGSPWVLALAGTTLGAVLGALVQLGVGFAYTRAGADRLAALKGFLEGLREELKQRVNRSPIQAAEFVMTWIHWLALDPKYHGVEAARVARALKKESGELRALPWAVDRTRAYEKAVARRAAAYAAFLPLMNVTAATAGAVAPAAGGGAAGAGGGGAAGGGGGGAG